MLCGFESLKFVIICIASSHQVKLTFNSSGFPKVRLGSLAGWTWACPLYKVTNLFNYQNLQSLTICFITEFPAL
jgi:hypothetical protein